jgi:3-oxoacyl-[acyl-carrier protein] reductase
VTGAAQGLGRAIAERLASDGHDLVVIDVNDDGVEAAAKACGGRGFQADISDRPRLGAIAAEVGPVQILINNAGIWRNGSIIDAADAELDQVLAVNLVGTLNCCRAFVPSIVAAGGGAVVNISSVAAASATHMVQMYSVTKGGIETLTRQLAQDLGPQGVRVNAVGPGAVLTEGSAYAYQGEGYAQRVAGVPLGRIGTPQDIANAVSFLVSDQASYISGQILYVDGGMTARGR